MNITTYSLVEICKIRSGKRLPKGCDFSEAPTAYKYIRARDIKNGTIDGSDLVYISEEVQSKIKKYIVNTNDIVITIVGASVGDVAYVASEFDGMNLTENAVRLTEFAPYINSKYLMYILNSSEYWELMQQIAGGAAQPKLGIYKIEAIKVHLPPKEVQDRIVDILCTYEDLIKNNQKQIKLLEEAAQRLYKEWFVDLRFPGYETIPIIDGIPDGWEDKSMEEICDSVGGGTPSTKNDEYYRDGKIKWVTPTDITRKNGLILLDTEKKITEEGLQHSSAKMVPPYTILMTSRASVGFFGLCEYEVCTNQGFISCVPYKENTRFYLLYNLMNRVDEIRAKASGSTFLEISKKNFRGLRIVLPTDSVLDEFTKLVFPMVRQMETLTKSIATLQEARDRLLPKLMNGEIEV